MKTQTIIALKILLAMTVLTGIIYPFLMTGIAQVIFPAKANGSLIIKNGNIIGSELIGQKFDSSIYFWSRPSAVDYNPIPSAASNFGPTSEKLKVLVEDRRKSFTSENSITDTMSVPKEMIFASASGLDPHISPKAALMQLDRVAKARNLSEEQKNQLLTIINSLSENAQFGIFGENRINVLGLNLKTDALFANK
jgi:potassium-transporting ATPase KdpC subunit